MSINVSVPFSALDAWMESLYSQIEGVKIGPACAQKFQEDTVFSLCALLLEHDVFGSEDSYAERVDQICRGEVATFRNRGRELPTTVKEYVRLARRCLSVDLTLRSGLVRIKTDNNFSREFLPPMAERARSVMSYALVRTRNQLAHKGDLDSVAPVLLLNYFLSLTAHPFRDGNGRSSRWYFARGICAAAGPGSMFILALVLLHRHRSSAFHLAARLARLGDFSTMLMEYRNCLDAAATEFSEDLAELSQVCIRTSDHRVTRAQRIMREMRVKAQRILHSG